jgi:16S rRNA processing protein RimM
MCDQKHAIAKITTSSGFKGEVRLRPFSRYSIDYIINKSLHIGVENKKLSDIKLENTIGLGKKMRFKFKGIDSIHQANSLVGKIIYIKADKSDEINLISEKIIGFDLETESGKKAGVLKDVMWLPANDVYVVLKDGKELLIPIISEVIKKLDVDNKKIIIADVDGLLEI